MKCYNCDGELDPTLIYCNHCGVPTETEPEDIYLDAEDRAQSRKEFEAVAYAKSLFVTACFALGCTMAIRWVVLKPQSYEHFPAYRVSRQLVDEEGYSPPVALDIETLRIPLPTGQ